MTAHSFSVVFADAGDGWVYAHVPELPEAQTQGDNLDQAREMVRDGPLDAQLRMVAEGVVLIDG
jgi:hypothetical protein